VADSEEAGYSLHDLEFAAKNQDWYTDAVVFQIFWNIHIPGSREEFIGIACDILANYRPKLAAQFAEMVNNDHLKERLTKKNI
jgi:hypothetical protein